MSYDLSFDKKSAALLGVCAIIIAALFVAAGFLLGMHHSLASSQDQSLSRPAHAPVLPSMLSKGEPEHNPKASSPPPAAPSPAPLPQPKTGAALAPAPPQATPSPTDPAQPAFTLQFGAFSEKPNADNLIKELKAEGISAVTFIARDHAGRTWYTVRSGAYATMPEASTAAISLRETTRQPVLVRPAHTL